MEISIRSERKSAYDPRAFSVKICEALNARTDKDVQCVATCLNFCRGKFVVAVCHGYHLIIRIIKLICLELSHYPILASDSILVIDKWWDGSRLTAARKRLKESDVSKGPVKRAVV